MEENDIIKGIELLQQAAKIFQNHMPVYSRCKEAIWHAKQARIICSDEVALNEETGIETGFQQSQ